MNKRLSSQNDEAKLINNFQIISKRDISCIDYDRIYSIQSLIESIE